ncbi:MAG: DNA translocase FtsK, partial [Clostridia bacterium]|nr:DNA translocase FtsK [Clostridia bacterium]
IAGQTGSGKSVCINSIIMSLLFRVPPEKLWMILVDPKVVELAVYRDIPHLKTPVVTDPKKAAGALSWAVAEMERRYRAFGETGVREIEGYNRKREAAKEEALPYLVVIVDEMADLMMVAPKDVEESVCRIAQLGRAAGVHLIVATQRPSVNVITGLIKANLPSRIAFATASQIDSRTILDYAGAEKLLGRGDMLYYPSGASKATRVQGCFVSDDEVEDVVSYVKNQLAPVEYDEAIAAHEIEIASNKKGEGDDEDELLNDAAMAVAETGEASVSLLQRRLRIGYARAGRLIDILQARGYVGPKDGTKAREVLISREQARVLKEEL